MIDFERKDTRRRLIDAATDWLSHHSAQALTLEAVAKHAGVSKGGLLHHFASKEALVEAVLRELFASFERQVSERAAGEPDQPGRWLRAYVAATYADHAPPLDVFVNLLSQITAQPGLLELVRGDFLRWQARLLDDGVPAERATIVRQAADAFWSERLLDVAATDDASRQRQRDALFALIAGEAL
ncbi:MAG: TetR/AcrR family transcriptional regulator [Roseiflexaceae bacterium]|nr:TetR/AcrR family transcriptional regulator [Roseiflexaceae bacterium]